MKSTYWLLSLAFVLFYLFADLNWQLGNYLLGNLPFATLRSRDGLLEAGGSLLVFLLYSIISYGLFYQVYYRKNQKVLAGLSYLLIAIPIMMLLRYLVEERLLYVLFGYHNYSQAMRLPTRYFMDNIYYAIYYSTFGVIFFFIQHSAFTQRQQQALLLQHRTAELAFLRSQINPHFLFNSLNNIYALVYQQSAQALPSISKLAELLRYMLYEKADLVNLDKEVRYLLDFIDLQRMRYNFEPALVVSMPLPAQLSFSIAPLTLIPFVENAFKHGDLSDCHHPLTIRLSTSEKEIEFWVRNKISYHQKDQTGGVGLSNVSKRLGLLYGEGHRLLIEDDGHCFTVRLRLPTL